MIKNILAIETSCDDTSVALVTSDGCVIKMVSANQDLVHHPFGGIVPEIASRNHTISLLPLIDEIMKNRSWSDIDGIAVTSRPGLIGSLLVGVVTAKCLALTLKKPLIGVNHIEGHLIAPFLKDEKYNPPDDFQFPYIGLAISGGHTALFLAKSVGEYNLLGKTLDDAAGEAFDKFAKMVGLGYPGGVQVDQYAKQGQSDRFHFPKALMKEGNLNFSFSGLKTSALTLISSMSKDELKKSIFDLCASYQKAIVEVLITKLEWACRAYGLRRAVITGGVSANSLVRKEGYQWAERTQTQLLVPPIRYCTDNAAMIGLIGIWKINKGEQSDQTLTPSARSLSSDFINV